jgi:hypothetical protein
VLAIGAKLTNEVPVNNYGMLQVVFDDGLGRLVRSRLGSDDAGLVGVEIRNVAGCLVTPGLIDLHTHVCWGGTSLGVDPLRLRGGCTTLVDTGSAGPGNNPGFLERVIKPSPVRIIAYLNVSFAGIFAFPKRIMVGEGGDLRLMAPIDPVEVARQPRNDRGDQGPGRQACFAESRRDSARDRARGRRCGSGCR